VTGKIVIKMGDLGGKLYKVFEDDRIEVVVRCIYSTHH